MVDIPTLASSVTGALLLLIFVGLGAQILGESVGLNTRLLGLIGACVALYIIYKTHGGD